MTDSTPFRVSTTDLNGVRDQIVSLRCRGFGVDRIAAEVGLSRLRVASLLRQEFEERFADRDELKRQTAMQLDQLARPLWDKYESSADRRDAEALLKIIDRRCRLLGLDEAVKYKVEVEELSDEELTAQLAIHGHGSHLALPAAEVDHIEDAEFTSLQSEPESQSNGTRIHPPSTEAV